MSRRDKACWRTITFFATSAPEFHDEQHFVGTAQLHGRDKRTTMREMWRKIRKNIAYARPR
jgi:hypothetical protein